MKFLAKHKKPFECAIVDNPPHTPERARRSDGYWTDVCTRHWEIFKKNEAKYKAKEKPLWFIRGKKETNDQ